MVAAIMVAAGLSMVSNPFFGHLSDRIGRRRMYLIGVTVTALIAFPYFGLLQTGVPAVVLIARDPRSSRMTCSTARRRRSSRRASRRACATAEPGWVISSRR